MTDRFLKLCNKGLTTQIIVFNEIKDDSV